MRSSALAAIKIAGRVTLTDRGRVAAQQYGLTQGGAMDEKSYLWANYLLANDANAAAIECAVSESVWLIKADSQIAVCGAERRVLLNQTLLPMWHSFEVKAGDVLSIGWASSGVYSYIAIKGGFAADAIFSSKACVVREGLGGHKQGLPITTGDTLDFYNKSQLLESFNKAVPFRYRHDLLAEEITLRFLPCYQFEAFSEEARTQFLAQRYSLTSACDAMGFKLQGAPIAVPSNSLISEAIALGSIQITHQGQPIVLMRDRQTIGGYPKMGTVLSVDIEKLAQCVAGKRIRFVAVDINTAYQARLLREQFFKPMNE